MATSGDDDNLLLLHALGDADAATLELLSLITDNNVGAGGVAAAPPVAVASGHNVDPLPQEHPADDTSLLFAEDALAHLGLIAGGEDGTTELLPLSDMDALSFLDHDNTGETHVGSANERAPASSSLPTSSVAGMHAAESLPRVPATACGVIHRGKPLLPVVPILPRPKAPTTISKEAVHRKRAKDELEYLRQQVHVLEQRLDDLRQQRPPRGSSSAAAGSSEQQSQISAISSQSSVARSDAGAIDSSPGTALQSQQLLWKRIAKRQLDEKQKAEIENLKLKQRLETQLKIAQSLSKVLRKRPDVSWLDSRHQFGSKKLRIETLSESESVFRMLSERVETLFDRLDGVMRDSGLTDLKSELQDGVVKADELGRVFLEVTDCKIVPFDVHTTAAALWKILSSSSMTVSNGVYQAIDATEDTLRAQFAIKLKLRRSEAQVHVRLVGKRIIEASRVIFVWSSVGDSEGSLFGKDHLYLRESSWTVIEEIAVPVTSSSSTKSDPPQHHPTSTIIKSAMQMSPEMENDSLESSHQIGVFTDIVLSGFHQNLSILHQNIENLVMSKLLATG